VTPVRRGENRDKTLRNHHVVRSLKRVPWPDDGELDALELHLEPAWGGALSVAALVQEIGSLRILGASRLAL
jgi:hypothetical protein